MKRNIIFIFLFCVTNVFPQEQIKLSNSANIIYSDLDSLNLINYSKENGILNIDSIQIGIQFLPGPFDTNYVIVYEKPVIEGHNKVERNLHLSVNYWNNIDSTKIYLTKQFKFQSLDTVKTWLITTNIGTFNILQDTSVNYKAINNIVQLICDKNYIYLLTQYIEGNDTLISESVNFTDPNSLFDKLEYLTQIKSRKDSYLLNYDFYGRGEEVECVLEGDTIIVKNFIYWMN